MSTQSFTIVQRLWNYCNALLYLNDFEGLIKHGWFDLPPLLESEEKKG